MVRNLVGQPVQLPVRHIAAAERNGNRVRRLAGLRFEQFMDAGIAGIVGGRFIPLDGDSLPFGLRQSRKL
jgi:hypothetical protein